ncbi:MAG: phospho-N-acetylmuramoyl-pentapeptide-transferase [Clostridiales bacterium]|nr:phospho-N-acetylmuramoyl-pentapeptide-transferase [Candidatus Equinaster intestinalis]
MQNLDFSPVIAAFVAFGACALSGYVVIPFLHKLKFGQTILDIGPKWHKSKQGTPTMGGIMIFFGLILGTVCAVGFSFIFGGKFASSVMLGSTLGRFLAGLALAVCMGLIGFVDDYIKVAKKRNLGLTAKQKTFLQFFVSAAYLFLLYLAGMKTTWIPFVGNVSVVQGAGLLFWPISLLFIYGFTNAVNLTDGVDGLASTVTLIVACFFMFAASYLSDAGYNILAAALAGACAGFVLWNSHPAKVFMGDTGSMFLGGAVVALSFGIGRPIMLIFAGILYIAEALSVMIQVAYFKKTKKRLFKMAPIHHHFEMSGWSEEKIVLVFSLVTFIGCVISILPLILDF